MIQNLSKENFWDALQEKFPEAVTLFKQWIDDYKKEVNWQVLFNEDGGTMAPKFHEIPYEMQNGILARFELEYFNNGQGNGKAVYRNIAKEDRKRIEKLFAELNNNIKFRQTKLN